MANDRNLLHVMNTLRIPFIRDGLIETGQLNPNLASSGRLFDNLSILHVGCGGGVLTEPLAKLGGKIVGLDSDVEELQAAKIHASLNLNLKNLTYLDEDLYDHGKTHAEKYDAVIASGVIEYIANPETLYLESLACLKPGGSIFIVGVNKTSGSFLLGTLFFEKILKIIPKGTYTRGTNFISSGRTQGYLEKIGCSVKAVRGMKYNMFSRTMEWTDTTSMYYALHAVKKM